MRLAVFSVVMLSVVFSISSCSKNNNKDGSPSRATLLTASTWKYNDAGLDMNSDGIKEANLPPGILSGCDMDNTITFKSDKTGVIDEGATKCEPTNPQTVPFTWTLNATGDVLTMSTPLFAGLNGDVKIIELSSTKFTFSKLVSTTVQGFPVTANVIVFLKH